MILEEKSDKDLEQGRAAGEVTQSLLISGSRER